MIICPNCQYKNIDGTVFCVECGYQLKGDVPIRTQNVNPEFFTQRLTEEQIEEELKKRAAYDSPKTTKNSWISLHLLDSGKILSIESQNEITLGRLSEGQDILPDIDLTPFQAYANGVSRLHAVLKQEGKRVFVMDLGSSNGTYLNGKRLTPNVDQTLNHGDMLALGKLKIQILLRNI